ncbi:MAG: hypothetical protein GX774_17095 [Armatimonadetes bacterium]|jgi:hypothetical protein|nr:hypothetical protein [Armatimonadota bacterium]
MRRYLALLAMIGAATLAAAPEAAQAHCDTLDGPLVTAARQALDSGNLAPVLAWVPPQAEAQVKTAFDKSLSVRKLGPEAREMADHWFFETVVRVHRAGEGAPYTGLKPAGQIDPVIAATDQALADGTVDPIAQRLADAVKEGLHQRFRRLKALAPPRENVAAGRQWVAAYVDLLHYVEGLHRLVSGAAQAAPDEHEHAHGGHEAH